MLRRARLERHQGHGLLNLAGAVLVAEAARRRRGRRAPAPGGAEVIARARRDCASSSDAGPAARPPPPPGAPHLGVALPLPGGAQAQMRVEAARTRRGGPAGRRAAVTIHYDSPALGRVELRLALGPSGLVAGVGAAGRRAGPARRRARRRAARGPEPRDGPAPSTSTSAPRPRAGWTSVPEHGQPPRDRAALRGRARAARRRSPRPAAASIADRIIEEAEKADVPVRRDAALAAALAGLELGHEVPEELWAAVAEALAWAYALDARAARTRDQA